ncbi:MAG: hypothetical protein GTO51_05425 [Candidatus Latescibacteria bacterium]|nr:hypothetical protein [Candidatus Latescibacterota bacterium]NIO28444.1 hypothetical protein [Candidatus Latescibacterota bacterium]NIO55993.1 hypothetical protein [Candidatus Latescibacterota bacterium]NIT01957.1 hypothetical protein [Candidatus Latescibacterota bacterium]
MNEPELQKALDDIKVVREMIERNRRATMESGSLFIWWGALSLVAICLTYYFQSIGWYPQIGLIWGAFLIAGYAGTYSHIKKLTRSRPKNFIDRVIGATWFACGISVIIFAFIAPPAGAFDWAYIPPMVTIILAMGVFISSFLYDWRALSFTACLWWGGALAMLFYEEGSLLIMGILVGCGMIALGLAAKTRQKREELAADSSA